MSRPIDRAVERAETSRKRAVQLTDRAIKDGSTEPATTAAALLYVGDMLAAVGETLVWIAENRR